MASLSDQSNKFFSNSNKKHEFVEAYTKNISAKSQTSIPYGF